MNLQMHAAYRQLIGKAAGSHEQNRSPYGISEADVMGARLYCYAFRMHCIGTFHATRLAILERPSAGILSQAMRQRAVESLEDLAHRAMDAVPPDYRAVISTLYSYHRGIGRVVDGLQGDVHDSRDATIGEISWRFQQTIEEITTSNGLHLTRDTESPEQASFVVPNLGIVIVPLVYGDYHSWNLAYLAGEQSNVPTHRHQQGVEIHLGYEPTHGMTVLGNCRAQVDDGYAMPIPPQTDHGWVNTSGQIHHVPFIFGSLHHGGWGVFLDVEAQSRPVDSLELVDRNSPNFGDMVYLEQRIAYAAAMTTSGRWTVIPASATNRDGSGGLELSVTRADETGYTFDRDSFRIVSVTRGSGVVSIEGITRNIAEHDHFGVPAGMSATVTQTGSGPLVLLDVMIKDEADL